MRTATIHGGKPPVRSPIPFILTFTLLLLLPPHPATATSYVTVFTDHSCQTSYTDWDGPNGYPDGACTLFSDKAGGSFSSFMINGLDAGCTATIYAPNTAPNPCSGTAELATPYRCYNASDWTYYSIDRCTPPDQLSSSSSTPTASSSSSSSSTSATPTTTTIIGAAVGGGVGVLALVGGAGVWFCVARPRRRRRRKRAGRAATEGGGADGKEGGFGTVEISGAPILEMEGEGRQELPGNEALGEEGEEKEVRRAPVELPGDEGWVQSPGSEKSGEGR